MIEFFEPQEIMGAQTLRLAAESQNGGGDIFEIAATVKRIEPGDTEGWEREWRMLAERVEARAQAELAAGHTQAAMRHFFHANNYYRQSDLMIRGPDPRKRERFVKASGLFQEAAKLHTPPIERIEVRCGGETYDGYFCHPIGPASNNTTSGNTASGKWPVCFLIGGADAYAEEIFFSGRQALERGMALFLVDTPGRGSSLYVKEIWARPDYEVPVMASIDYLVGREDVDPERIGVIGISMAGYYAPRAAAFDKRIKALVAWCGTYDLIEDALDFNPRNLHTLSWIVGAKGEADLREKLKDFTLKDVAGQITCPTLISHGKNDALMSAEGAVKLYDAIASEDKELRIWDTPPGAGHCQFDAWTQAIPHMLDWLADRI